MVGAMPVNLIPKFCSGAMDSCNGTEGNEIQIGSRVKFNEDFGTVKYIGEVQGYKGTWYGVEWDDPARGKHDGAMDDVQYFKTSKPGAGSFIRPNKIAPFRTCAEAIRQYYGERESAGEALRQMTDLQALESGLQVATNAEPGPVQGAQHNDETVAAHRRTVINEWKREMGAPFIEMVGFEKIHQKQKFDRLLEVCVHDQNVAKAGDVASLCPNVRSLDASRNLFNGWREVITLAAQLPSLTELNVCNNRMAIDMPEETLSQLSINFANLEKINISVCDYSWGDILTLSHLWPRVREVVAAYNRIKVITPPPLFSFQSLTSLKMDGNPLDCWQQVLNLGQLPNLQELSLNDCLIREIRFNDDPHNRVELFEKLEVLFLNRNLINDWRSISELDKLSRLKTLYFLKNPIQSTEDYDTVSQLIIAKIGTLQKLNGSVITRELRRGAEYDYLKRYGAEWKLAQQDHGLKVAFDNEHCRFDELIQLYGIPDDSLLQKQQKNLTLTSQLLQITLCDNTGKSFKKKFPCTMAVQKLATLAQRLFAKGGNTGSLTLHLLDDQLEGAEIHLDNMMKDLAFYSIKNDDIILVKCR